MESERKIRTGFAREDSAAIAPEGHYPSTYSVGRRPTEYAPISDVFEKRYQAICHEFEKRDCMVLSTFEEYKQMKKIPTVFYNASCGHDHWVFYNVFLNRGTGIKCPSCQHKENTIKQKINYVNVENGQSYLLNMEDQGIDYLMEILSSKFVVKRTYDGCLADSLLQPKEVTEDKWLRIQVKTTLKPNRGYGFKCSSAYKDCIIFLLCLSDKRMWLLDGNTVKSKDKIAIGLCKSKYSGNEVTTESISDKLLEYYSSYPCDTFERINVPISIFAVYEQEFRRHREHMLPDIVFEYPNRQALVYDFIVSGKKVQEKIGTYKRNTTVFFSIHKSAGKVDNVRKCQQYRRGDNDLYWLNSPDKDSFWVIPEQIMIDNEMVDTEKPKGFIITGNSWLELYHLSYNNFDAAKFHSILHWTPSGRPLEHAEGSSEISQLQTEPCII